MAGEMICRECGQEMKIEAGVSYHLDADGNVDHDADADHVAIAELDRDNDGFAR